MTRDGDECKEGFTRCEKGKANRQQKLSKSLEHCTRRGERLFAMESLNKIEISDPHT
jgi:hypothetical protein